METKIQIDDISIRVIYKDIKNIHLRIYPPDGRVQISAPRRMDLASIQRFAASKQAWIQNSQRRIRSAPYQAPQKYRMGETHYLWGKSHKLLVNSANQALSVEVVDDIIVLTIRPRTTVSKKQQVMQRWYRNELRKVAVPLIENWEKVMQVNVARMYLRRMKSRWGSCNYSKSSIRLNTELAKRPLRSLDYVIAHEMVHLLEPSHNKRFKSLMTQYLPNWKQLKAELNYPNQEREV